MVKEGTYICPKCGGQLQPRGIVKRKVKNSQGEIFEIHLQRYSCRKCGAWHRVIPKDILPYKQYFRSVVESSSESLAYENVSDSTIKRWSRK